MTDSPPGPPRARPRGQRLVREPDDRVIGGVCSGVADALGIDATLVRVGTVVLTLITPWTIVAYLIALCVLPERPADQARVQADPPAALSHAHPAVLVAAVVVAIALLGDAWWLHPIPAALALVALGVWLVTRDRTSETRHSNADGVNSTTIPADVVETPLSDVTAEYTAEEYAAGPPGEPSPPGSTWLPGSPLADPTLADPTIPAPISPPPPPAEPPPAPAFFPIVSAILLVGGGLLWLADSLGAVDVGWRGATAVALLVVGTTLVIATWYGRASGLVAVAVLLSLLLVADETVNVPVTAGIGDRTVAVTTAAELDEHHELFIGDLTVDLRDMPARSGTAEAVEASVGIGQLQVIVPRDAAVTAEVHVKGGDVDWPGVPGATSESGVDVDRTFTLDGDPGGAHLHLDLSMGLGDVEVIRG